MTKPSIKWNNKLRLIAADVDETIADVYKPAEPAMITELNSLLSDGYKLFMVTGGSLVRVMQGITDNIDPALRHAILISHCSGAEVWGFEADGQLRHKPFYSLYEEQFDVELKQRWRDCVQELLAEFAFRPHSVEPILQFCQHYTDPLDIMLDDRGPQITLELVNAYDLSEEQLAKLPHQIPQTHGSHDLRIPVLERAEQLLEAAQIPITPRLGGTFALDLAVKNVSKATSIRKVIDDPEILKTIGLTTEMLQTPDSFEVWGDKFSVIRGGTDRHISEALSPAVRSIDFRDEDPAEFDPAFNTILWDGQHHLHDGLLEYLQTRH